MPQLSGRRRAPKRRAGPTAQPGVARPDPRVRFGSVPLRLFLGATFLYAGIQKLTDSGFLNSGGSTYIGKQLSGYGLRSPIGGLLGWLGQNLAVEVGVLIILVELAIGAGVLLGIWTRGLAVIGALLSVLLFLSATWDVQPYFLGSDSIYAVAWITLALIGDRGVWVPGQRLLRPAEDRRAPMVDPARREFLLRLGAAGVGAIWLLALLPRSRAATALLPASPTTTPTTPQPSLTPGAATPTGSPGAATPTAAAPAGTRIGTLTAAQSAGSLTYQDPISGDPAVVVSLGGQSVVAYDAVCTHAGCTVQYDPTQRLLICPCHGAAFDPAHSAQVVTGPAPTPLPGLRVTVTADGTIYTA
jgi:thiosulfate dehydrogenase (quinone) large subunit